MSIHTTHVCWQPVTELARAKINLTLHVLGRRPNGYHELASLVAFADVGDRLVFEPSGSANAGWRLEVNGPRAADIAGENLILKACRRLDDYAPIVRGHILLDKVLPVASGIGGGSADAAALLRAVRRTLEQAGKPSSDAYWHDIARPLGADVPVCFAQSTCLMKGIGDDLRPARIPPLDVVLVTPKGAVPPDKTASVFRALSAGEVVGDASEHPDPPHFAGVPDLIATMRRVGNDLERPASTVMPAIGEAKAALLESSGCLHAFLSGAGPTCAGIYRSEAAASAAADRIARVEPAWWVAACKVGA